MIKLTSIDRGETLRYLGSGKVEMNSETDKLLDICEKELLLAVRPKYLYKTIKINEADIIQGESVKAHLKGCEKAVLLCATLGSETDKLIRTAQVTDMAKAVVLDAMASSAVEKVCDEVESLIKAENPDKFLTWRFSPGYGDYPLSLQGELLRILDAPRRIGLCTNENSILTPTKSVTAIIGVSDNPIENKRKGCASCNLKNTCKFRKAGTRCEF
ncbi:MAG: methionine synthase [Ruminococcus sp.]|nr:methionine synthase [Ruminococcus sp.]